MCALGAPAATLWLVLNGIFRGLGDTRTPLLWALVFTALNAVLDPFFIFVCGCGAAGAASGTALAQTIACVPLLFALRDKIGLSRLGLGLGLRLANPNPNPNPNPKPNPNPNPNPNSDPNPS